MSEKKDTIDVSRRNFLLGFRKLREKDPEEFNAPIARSDGTFELLKQANLAYKDRDWENAAQNYRDLLKQESRNPDVRFRLGRCQYELAQYIQAKIQFEQVLRLREKDNDALLYLGLCLMRLERPEKAAVIWRMYRNLEAMPIQREVNIQLAFIETGENTPLPQEMANAVEKALQDFRNAQLKS